jgi:SAM-dependent methyltransferase
VTEQRFTFDHWAANYDAHRPGYPDALFEDLLAVSPTDRPVLEIGCGTGKATQGLARTNRAVTAIDPGLAMIEQARRRIGDGQVRFEQSTFEAWEPAGGPFGLIACAQAWHWIDPAVGFAKAAALLGPGGVLAIFGNEEQAAPDGVRAAILHFHARIRQAPNVQYGGGLYTPGGPIQAQFGAASEFQRPEHRVYSRTITHTSDSYVALTATYSDVQAQPQAVRDELLTELHAALIACGDSFGIPVETHLYWAGR